MKSRKIIRLIFFVLISSSQMMSAQVKFSKIFGSLYNTSFQSVSLVDDNYYLMGNFTDNMGTDIILIKTDQSGDTIWTKKYDFMDILSGVDFQKVGESGFIILGTHRKPESWLSDICLIRINSDGDTLWTKSFDLSNYDQPESLVITADGGFVITGSTQETEWSEIFLMKTDAGGKLVWLKSFGSSDDEFGRDIVKDDDGFIITGTVRDDDGTGSIGFLLKTNASGDSVWMKKLPYYAADNLIRTLDGGLMVLGVNSLLKTDGAGDTLWTEIYDISPRADAFYSIIQTSDGGYLLGGYVNGTVSTRPQSSTLAIVKLDPSGKIEWHRRYSSMGLVFSVTELIEKEDGYAFVCSSGHFFRTDKNGCFTQDPVISGIDYFCTGDSTALSTSLDFDSYIWSTGAVSESIFASITGGYSVHVIDSNNCPLWSDTIDVREQPLPVININPGGATTICEGDSVHLIAIISNNDPEKDYSFIWNNNPDSDDELIVRFPGIYSVFVEDNYGCNTSDSLEIIVRYPYQDEQFCVITVDLATGKNMLVWEKTRDKGTAAYNIYREAGIGDYRLVDQVDYTGLSIYKDTAVNPKNRPYLYKITSVDTCGNESLLANNRFHKPIHLSWVSSVSGINLKWTDYEIEDTKLGDYMTSYEIYRGTDSTGLEFYTSVGSINDYTDTDPQALIKKFYYRIAGVLKDPCNPEVGKKAGSYRQSMSNLEDNKLGETGLGNRSPSDKLSVYPNPFTDQATIQFTKSSGVCFKLVVTDLSGRTVRRVDEIIDSKFSFNRDGLPSGLYILQLVGPKTLRGIMIIE